MTRSITIALQIRGKGRRNVRITPRWAGEGLAVHKAVIIDGIGEPQFAENCPGIWTLTHVHSGMRAGMFHGNLWRAIAFAREWDAAFADLDISKVPAKLKKDYLAALAAACDGPSRLDIIEMGV